eukprot:g31014.t1
MELGQMVQMHVPTGLQPWSLCFGFVEFQLHSVLRAITIAMAIATATAIARHRHRHSHVGSRHPCLCCPAPCGNDKQLPDPLLVPQESSEQDQSAHRSKWSAFPSTLGDPQVLGAPRRRRQHPTRLKLGRLATYG